MNPESSTSPKFAFALPLILTALPVFGSLVGAIPQMQSFTVLSFFASPFLSLAAGIILGCNTGQSAGGKFLFSILWTVGSLAVSLALQGVGCSLTNFRFL